MGDKHKMEEITIEGSSIYKNHSVRFVDFEYKTNSNEVSKSAEGKIASQKANKPRDELFAKVDFPKLMGEINACVCVFNTKILFRYDEESGRQVITVIDKGTGEIIRQIPPDEILHLVSKLKEISGIIFQKEV